jgi:TonB family protein
VAESYTTFGDYLLLRERAQDGLGTLWRAGELERAGFKRIVWLRRFDGAGLDRAALEAEGPVVRQLAQAFKATNVVRNATFGSEGGVPFLAFDYVPGQPLDQLLARVARDQFPIAIDNALLLAEKIAAAVAAAQAFEARGEPLIHGFLLPHLVLVGNDGEAMVAGFGLAKGFLSNLDRVAVQEMAAPYLAPEVLTTYSASRRADVYSLGAILYHLLCGRALAAETGERGAMLASPQLALDEGPVPDDVLAVLRKALAERPEERYSSAVDFKRDLEKLLYGGAYAPTTFNLALFMDRLCRQEIEEEDRELQRERGIDVTPYYRPPKTAGETVAAAAAAATPSSRTGLFIALGAIIVLLVVVGYLVLGRAAPPAQPQQNVADLVQSEVARQLAAKEQALRSELDKERQETEKLRVQLATQEKAAANAGTKLSAEDQRKQTELQQQLAAREEEQKRREQELKKLQEERARAAAARPTALPVTPTAAPTPAPEPTRAPRVVVPPTPAETKVAGMQTPPKPTPTVAVTLPPAGLGTTVREGEMVDFTQVDTPPEELVTVKPTFGRAAIIAKARGVVILSVLVNGKGGVDDVKVLRPFPAANVGIDAACVEAAKKYRFRPATKSGVNVKTWVTVTFQIDLTRGL